MPNRDNIQWFDNGTYQKHTDREIDAILLYPTDSKGISVFDKDTGNFVTTCQLTPKEEVKLMMT